MGELIICGYLLVMTLVYFFFMWVFKDEGMGDAELGISLAGSIFWIISVPTLLIMWITVCIIEIIKILKHKAKHMKEK